MILRVSLILFTFISFVEAEELDPALAPIAEMQRKQTDEILAAGNGAIKQATDAYLKELESAEEKATKGGHVAVLAAIRKERMDIEKGVIAPTPNADLPKTLQVIRKKFIRSKERIEDDVFKRRNDLNGRYLAKLARIQADEGSNKELADQIEAEKTRVISGIVGPITNLQTQIAGTHWKPFKGTFSLSFDAAGMTNGTWKYTTPERNAVVVHWDDHSSATWTLEKDGKTLARGGVSDMKLVQPTK